MNTPKPKSKHGRQAITLKIWLGSLTVIVIVQTVYLVWLTLAFMSAYQGLESTNMGLWNYIGEREK